MLWLAVTNLAKNLAKKFDLHSRFGSVVLVVVVEGTLTGVSLSECWDYTPFIVLFNDFIAST